ncbi:hypothetical protein BJY01DRAFT_230529 [Aspergillus pseudoustus]|uniref:Uncharacterized protein n=1 Tax=Aspergillus pseudoustus TaxID=1810923 RepID=A0ABR4I8X5_9EURO
MRDGNRNKEWELVFSADLSWHVCSALSFFFSFCALLEDGLIACLLDSTRGTSRDIKCHVHLLYKGLVFAVSFIVTLFSKLYLY